MPHMDVSLLGGEGSHFKYLYGTSRVHKSRFLSFHSLFLDHIIQPSVIGSDRYIVIFGYANAVPIPLFPRETDDVIHPPISGTASRSS